MANFTITFMLKPKSSASACHFRGKQLLSYTW